MRQTSKQCAAVGNRVIHAAGFASRKWELKVINYPKASNAISLAPAAWIHSKVNFEDVFVTGATIQGSPFLWLPLPSVPLWPGDPTRQMSPKKFVQTFGPVLVTIRRPGKPPLLGQKVKGPVKAQPFGAFRTPGQLRRGLKAKTGTITVIPLFVGVPRVVIEKKFDVHSAIDAEFQKSFQPLYKQFLEPYEGRR